MNYLLPLLVFSSAFANIEVSRKDACPNIVQGFGISASSPSFNEDIRQCKEAQKTCSGVRQTFAQTCSETMGFEHKQEMSWQNNMAIAAKLSLHNLPAHMATFCTTYMPDKIWQTETCNNNAELCRRNSWALSNGRKLTCQAFSVNPPEYILGANKAMRPVCDLADELAQRINAEVAERQRQCAGYGATAGASEGQNPQKAADLAAGVNSGAPMDYDLPEDVPTQRNSSESFATPTPSPSIPTQAEVDDNDMVMVDPNEIPPVRALPPESGLSRFFSGDWF